MTGSADSAQGAADVTNAAADVLVDISNARFKDEAGPQPRLPGGPGRQGQDRRGGRHERQARNGYEKANGITDRAVAPAPQRPRAAADPGGPPRGPGDNVARDPGQLDCGQRPAGDDRPDGQSTSNIVTGRSTTGMQTRPQQSTTYQALLVDRNQLEGELAGVPGPGRLADQRAGRRRPTGAATDQQAGLDAARPATSTAGPEELPGGERPSTTDAVDGADQGNVEITRIDEAQVADVPGGAASATSTWCSGCSAAALAGCGPDVAAPSQAPAGRRR